MVQSSFLNQLYALLWKQCLLYVRNWKVAFVLMMGPALIVLICSAVSNINLDDVNAEENTVTEGLWSVTTFGSEAKLQACKMREFGGAPRGNDPCVAIAYAPAGVEQVKKVMERLALKNDLGHKIAEQEAPSIAEIGAVDVLGFETTIELEHYLRRHDTYGYIQAAVFFNDDGVVSSVDHVLEESFYNSFEEDESKQNDANDINVLHPQDSILAFRIMTNATSTIGDTQNSKFNIQAHVTESLMAFVSGNNDATLKVNVKTYQDPESNNVQGTFLLTRTIAPLLYIGSMGIFVTALQEVVMEKVTKRFDHLRSMGLSDTCYWMAWIIFYSVVSFINIIPAFIVGYATNFSLFVGTPPGLMFGIWYVYNLSLVGFALFLSTFTTSSYGANVIAVLVSMVGLLVLLFLYVFERPLYSEPYHQFNGGGAALDALHYIPIFAFPRMMDNVMGMTIPFRGGSPRPYTMEDFNGGTYQYYDLLYTGFGHRASQLPEDPRVVLPTKEECSKAGRFELDSSDDSEYPYDETFREFYTCLTHVNDGEVHIPSKKTNDFQTPASAAASSAAFCTAGWSWAAGKSRELCEKHNGLFYSQPRTGKLMIHIGGPNLAENMVKQEMMKIVDWPFVEVLRDVPGVFSGYLVETDGLDGFCACVHENPSDKVLLTRMVGFIFISMFLAWYLGQVFSTGRGKGKHFLFFLTPWYWFPRIFSRPEFVRQYFAKPPLRSSRFKVKDDDVVAEARRTRQMIADGNVDPVVLNDLVKFYGIPLPESRDDENIRQVDGLTMGFKKGEVFALLGHNGAGKTTLINMLLGLTTVTGGSAQVNGFDVDEKIDTVRQYVSSCPQHDIVWDQLSAPEHLKFFGLFQGLNPKLIGERSDHLLEKVKLTVVGNRVAGAFSGGMKRRLSVAISAIGNRPVVVLDEPTTGMDPRNRTHVWELINEMKEDKVVILSTHAMDEATNIGDRIGIMKKGQLIALGSGMHLRKKFGGIHRIEVVPHPSCNRFDFVDQVTRTAPHVKYFETAITATAESIKFNLEVKYSDELSALFQLMRDSVDAQVLQTWIFSGATLEDVFLKLTDEVEDDKEGLELKKKPFKILPRPFWMKSAEEDEGDDADSQDINVWSSSNDLEQGGGEVPEKSTFVAIRGTRGLFKQFRALMWKEFWQNWGEGHNVIFLIFLLIGFRFVLEQQNPTESLEAGFGTDNSITPERRLRLDWMECMDECIAGVSVPAQACLNRADKSVDIVSCLQGYNQTISYMSGTQDLQSFANINEQRVRDSLDQYGDAIAADDINSIEKNFPGYFDRGYNVLATSCRCTDDLAVALGTPNPIRFPFSNKNAKWISGQILPHSSNPFEFAVDRILVDVEPKSNDVTVADLKSSVGSLCPNPSERGFLEPASRSNAREIGFSCAYNTGYYEWGPRFTLSFPGESGRSDLRCLGEVYDVANGKPSFDAAKNAHDLLVSQSGGLLSKFPSKVLQQERLGFTANVDADSVYYDSSPLLCPAEYYQGFERKEGSTVDDSLLSWLSESAKELNQNNVTFPPQEEASYKEIDSKTAPLALVFNEVQLDDKSKAPVLEFTLNDMRTFGNASSYMRSRFSDAIVAEMLTGMSTAVLRQLQEVHDNTNVLPEFTQNTNVHVGVGNLDESWLFGLENPQELIYGIQIRTSTAMIFTLLVVLFMSMTLPQITYGFVQERELRVRHMMQMMGLSPVIYFACEYVFWMLSLAVFLVPILGIIQLLTPVVTGQLIFVLFLYLNVIVLHSMLFSTIFTRGTTARVVMCMVVILFLVLAIILHHIVFVAWDDDANVSPRDPLSVWWHLIPTNGVYFGVMFSLLSSMRGDLYGVSVEVYNSVIVLMICELIVAGLLGLYFDQVSKKEYGVSRHWLFPLEELFKMFNLPVPQCLLGGRQVTPPATKELVVPQDQSESLSVTESNMDKYVLEEYKYVNESDKSRDCAIYIRGLRMVFPAKPEPKIAVKDLHLHIERGECFGLLGPNGAGKSTTMSVLTGLYPPTSGEALIEGYSISTEMRNIRKVVGICPQQDIVWPNISVLHHLQVYAGLSGADRSETATVVHSVLDAMGLTKHKHKKARGLSGGMRRRLSMAISLVGNPKVWFLDEPTTGVDPDTRRKIWACIQREKKNRCVVLTTHSMEEAEVLCDRIGIMAHGQLRALGTVARLKQQFATGYYLSVSTQNDFEETANNFIRGALKTAVEMPKVSNNLVYNLEQEDFEIAVKKLNEDSADNGITDYELRPSTLEDVFLKVATDSELEHGVA